MRPKCGDIFHVYALRRNYEGLKCERGVFFSPNGTFMIYLRYFLCFVVFICLPIFGDETVLLTVLHANDHHGSFWPDDAGEGGLAAQATLIRQIRKEVAAKGGYVLLLSAGDVNSGAAESNLFHAEPDFLAMKEFGFAAMCLGNHEFDNDLPTLRRQEQLVNFPFLSANIFQKGTTQPAFTPYVIKEFGKLRIGILGLTIQNVPQMSFGSAKDEFAFRDPLEIAAALAPTIKKQVHLLIALTHLGYANQGPPIGDISLARTVKEIAVIVGGHSHTTLSTLTKEGDTIIVQAGSQGKYLGRLDLELSSAGAIIQARSTLLPVKECVADNNVKALLTPYYEKAKKTTGEELAVSTAVWNGERSVLSRTETPLANLVTLAIREATQADVAVIPAGLIRTGLPQGTITYGHVLTLHPFGLSYATIDFTGDELRDYLQLVVQRPYGTAEYPQFSGVKIKMAEKLQIKEILVQKENSYAPVNSHKLYKVATIGYIASGGNNYPVITNHPHYRNLSLRDQDVLKAFLQKRKIINPNDFQPVGSICK